MKTLSPQAAGIGASSPAFSDRRTLAGLPAALAYAALTRPTYQAFALVGAGVLLLVAAPFPRIRFDDRAALKAGGVLLLGSALLLGGFSLVNSAKFGYFGLTPLVGFNLSSRTVPFVERLPDQHAAIRETLIRARDAQLVKRGGSHTGYQYIWSVRPRLSEVTGLSTPELSKHLVRLNLLLIRKAPLSYLQEVARSALVYWMPSTRDLSTGKSSVLHLLWGGLHFAVLALFGLQLAVLLGLLLYLLSRRWLGPRSESAAPEDGVTATEAVSYAVAVALIFYTLIISCMVDVGHTRHRASTDAVILFATFLGLHVWGRLARASGDSGRRHAGA